MAIRKANAVWNGGLQDGNGSIKLGSGAFEMLKNEAGLAITRIELDCAAEVPGIDAATFAQQAESAKANCIISKALSSSIEIVLNAKLV